MIARRIKQGVLGAGKALGLFTLVRNSRWRQQRLLVLCYHGVSTRDEHEWSDLYVSADHLARRFAMLKQQGYQVLPLHDAVEALYAGALPPRAVAITFDDGAADFHSRALPVIEEFGFPVTLYLTTYYVEFDGPVFDTMLGYLLWKGEGQSIRLPALDEPDSLTIPADKPTRQALQLRLRDAGKARLDAAGKDLLLEDLATQLDLPYREWRNDRLLCLMTPEQVAGLGPLVDIQLHTHRHRTPDDETQFRKEIADNRVAIARLTGTSGERLVHFCYPSGEYTDNLARWLRAEGVRSSTTCDHGLASVTTDPMFVPRLVDTMVVPDLVFEAWLCGAAQALPRRRA